MRRADALAFMRMLNAHAIKRRADAGAEMPTQPPMMNFKNFLNSQDDNIGEDDAVRKYRDYKTDFKRHQISEYFLQHKDEEW